MKTRNTHIFKSVLALALVVGTIMSAAPTIALAANNSQISPISEYYANYYGSAKFENSAMTFSGAAPSELFYANNFVTFSEKAWSTIDQFYANFNGNAVFENTLVLAAEASPSELFYADYYGDLKIENPILASSRLAASELFYADYFDNASPVDGLAIAAEKGWSTVDEFYANSNGDKVFENHFFTVAEANPSELFYAAYYGDVVLDTQLVATAETSPIKLFYANSYSTVTFD